MSETNWDKWKTISVFIMVSNLMKMCFWENYNAAMKNLFSFFFFFEILVKILPLISHLYQMNECGERVLSKNLPVVINSGRKKTCERKWKVLPLSEEKNAREREKKVFWTFPRQIAPLYNGPRALPMKKHNKATITTEKNAQFWKSTWGEKSFSGVNGILIGPAVNQLRYS